MTLKTHIIPAVCAALLSLAPAGAQAAAAQAPAVKPAQAPSAMAQKGEGNGLPQAPNGQAAAGAQKPGDEAYTYQSAGRRDPFLSLIYVAKEARKKEKSRLRIPLEQYPVDQMVIEAIITGPGIPSYALVRLPNGKHYNLRIGTVAGVNRGRVIRITPGRVVVRETVTDLTGKKSTHEITLKLRKEEE